MSGACHHHPLASRPTMLPSLCAVRSVWWPHLWMLKCRTETLFSCRCSEKASSGAPDCKRSCRACHHHQCRERPVSQPSPH